MLQNNIYHAGLSEELGTPLSLVELDLHVGA
jgi:hypothetical protein